MSECNHAVTGSCEKCEPCGVCGRPKGDPHRYPVAGECTAPDSSDYTVSLQCLSIALRNARDDVKAAEERGRRRGDAERDEFRRLLRRALEVLSPYETMLWQEIHAALAPRDSGNADLRDAGEGAPRQVLESEDPE